jgi:hypothetical protein
MFALALVGTEKEEDCVIKRYDCDFTVETAGDGLWGCEAGRKVTVTGITVIEHTWQDGTKWTHVTAEHDTTWDIYTDTGFESAISEAVGFRVGFTEQGMQDDNMASLEV